MKRIRIRPVRPGDAAAVREIYAPYVSDNVTSFELAVPTAEEFEQRIQAQCAQFPWLVAESDEAGVLGYAYASPHKTRWAYRWSVDVTVYLKPQLQRRGAGRALYDALFALLRRQGYVNAYAGITLPNPGSEGLHRAMGFTEVGIYRGVGFKCGAWRDVIWLQLRLADPKTPSDSLAPTTDLWNDPAVLALMDAAARRIRLGP